MSKERANTLERDWMGRVAALRCVLCGIIGMNQQSRTTVHHLEHGTGIGQRSPHFLTIALCHDHHLGANGINGLGSREFARRYGVSELELLNLTIEGVYKASKARV